MSSTLLKPLVIIADDVEQWRQFSSQTIRKYLPDCDMVFASNADEVVALTTSNQSRLALMALDWHYGPKGNKDFPYIINQLAVSIGEVSLPIVCVSGTVANVSTVKALKQGLRTPFIDKINLIPTLKTTESNSQISEALGSVLDRRNLTKLDAATLAILNSAAPYSERISNLMEIEDQIKAKCAKVLSHLVKYQDHDQITRTIELIQLPFKSGLETLHAVHEFKNQTYLAINNIIAAGLAPEAEKELQQVLSELSEFVKKKYQLLINPVHYCDLIYEIHQLINQKYADHKEKFIFSLDFDRLPIQNLDPKDCQIIFSNLIQNALIYGHPQGKVRIIMNGNELEISNSLPAGKKVTFEILNNNLQLQSSLSKDGCSTGTGLKQILEVVNKSTVFNISTLTYATCEPSENNSSVTERCLALTFRIIVNPENIDFENAVYHDYSSQIKQILVDQAVIDKPVLTRRPLIKNPQQLFSTIAVIDHDGARSAEHNFINLIASPPSGFNIEIIDQQDIYEFWNIDFSKDNNDELIQELLNKNFDVLTKSCICMIHATPSGFIGLAEAIKREFPHIVLLPLSSFPHETFGSLRIQQIFTNFKDLAVQQEELLLHASDSDLSLLEEFDKYDIYQRSLHSEEFSAIVRAAQQIALERSGFGL